jgi:hypothetical protein
MGQQFKVGDRVRLVRTDYRGAHLQNGATGAVKYVGAGVVRVCVDADPDPADARRGWNFYPHQIALIEAAPTAESLLLALGTASRELEDAITAEREAHAAVAEAVTRREQAAEAHAEAMKAIRKAAMARAA